MAQQTATAAAETAAKEPAADSQPAPSFEDRLAEKDLRIEELEAQNDSLSRSAADKEAAIDELASKLSAAQKRVEEFEEQRADAMKRIAEKSAAIDELASKLADARELLPKPEPEPEPPPPPPVIEFACVYRCVARRKMRSPLGWVSDGEEFEATGEQLEGYSHGQHFEIVKD